MRTYIVADQELRGKASQSTKQRPATIDNLSLTQEGEALGVSAQTNPVGMEVRSSSSSGSGWGLGGKSVMVGGWGATAAARKATQKGRKAHT